MKTNKLKPSSVQGVGLGLRSQHYAYILQHLPKVPWFEVLTDNYLEEFGAPLVKLDTIRSHYPMVMHGVGLSIGSSDSLNIDYLKRVKALADRLEPAWVSDHICWTSINGRYSHELLPLPYTEEAVCHLVKRIQQVQDYLKRPLMLENISSYINFDYSEMTEAEFINAIARRSGCDILLDINNIYVNSQNHLFDCIEYLHSINRTSVKQFHLAGYEKIEHLLVDNHGAAVYPEVWKLYKQAVKYFGSLPTSIEWDNNIPEWQDLILESQKAQTILDSATVRDAICN